MIQNAEWKRLPSLRDVLFRRKHTSLLMCSYTSMSKPPKETRPNCGFRFVFVCTWSEERAHWKQIVRLFHIMNLKMNTALHWSFIDTPPPHRGHGCVRNTTMMPLQADSHCLTPSGTQLARAFWSFDNVASIFFTLPFTVFLLQLLARFALVFD